ncbi:hypothetical protein TCAL_16960 [Tigriopus californicus]|uniref:Uncharacterized protein n=1 Tax=Tigriopus californicus TaxID=6832 RepID=A0A553NQW5_TIGCA|nr:hypothetical protein TCAL_16960 [Tigriopus californicus]
MGRIRMGKTKEAVGGIPVVPEDADTGMGCTLRPDDIMKLERYFCRLANMRPRVLHRRHFRGSGAQSTATPSSSSNGPASSNGNAKPGQTRGDSAGPMPGFATYQAAMHSNPSVFAALNNNPINYPLPSLPADGQVVFELIIFAYSMVAMLLQHLHLYRSVFWLPHSYNTEAVLHGYNPHQSELTSMTSAIDHAF